MSENKDSIPLLVDPESLEKESKECTAAKLEEAITVPRMLAVAFCFLLLLWHLNGCTQHKKYRSSSEVVIDDDKTSSCTWEFLNDQGLLMIDTKNEKMMITIDFITTIRRVDDVLYLDERKISSCAGQMTSLYEDIKSYYVVNPTNWRKKQDKPPVSSPSLPVINSWKIVTSAGVIVKLVNEKLLISFNEFKVVRVREECLYYLDDYDIWNCPGENEAMSFVLEILDFYEKTFSKKELN